MFAAAYSLLCFFLPSHRFLFSYSLILLSLPRLSKGHHIDCTPRNGGLVQRTIMLADARKGKAMRRKSFRFLLRLWCRLQRKLVNITGIGGIALLLKAEARRKRLHGGSRRDRNLRRERNLLRLSDTLAEIKGRIGIFDFTMLNLSFSQSRILHRSNLPSVCFFTSDETEGNYSNEKYE